MLVLRGRGGVNIDERPSSLQLVYVGWQLQQNLVEPLISGINPRDRKERASFQMSYM